MTVVDTNVLAYLLIPGSYTALAEAARGRENQWVAPSLLIHEWLNVVAHHVQRNLMDRDRAVRLYRRGLSVVRIHNIRPDPLRVLNLHIASKCSSYDCQFVATAVEMGVKLLTVDREILDAFPGVAVHLEHF